MSTKKIIMYEKFFDIAEAVTDAEFGRVVLLLGKHFFKGEEIDMSAMTQTQRVLYKIMYGEIKANLEKYDEVCEKRRQNALKRYRKNTDANTE